MKIKFLVIIVLFAALLSCSNGKTETAGGDTAVSLADYQIQSEYLKNPSEAIAYVKLCADFWIKSFDTKNGGFFTNVAEDGTPEKKGGFGLKDNFKNTLTQSRNAYGFARAYMLTGNKEYLDYARRAVDFLRDHSWDKQNSGFHSVCYGDGRNGDQDINFDLYKIKWSFTQHYALLGVAALYDATRNQAVYDFLLKGRNIIDQKLWDPRPASKGYYDKAEYDWSKPFDKGFTPTVDCITTHGESLYLLTGEERFKTRLLELAGNVMDRIVPTAAERKMGFAESFNSDWTVKNDGFMFIGHVLKTAWCLGRVYLVDNKPEYRDAAERLMKDMWEKGWDKKSGGPFNLADSIKGAVTDNSKNWWTLEQAVNAGLILYYITGDKLYLKMADESLDFYMKHLVDWKNGDVYQASDNDGIIHTTTVKGDIWKAGYHSIETGWFVYLYGNLYLNKLPVTLYYWIDKSGKERTLTLNPLSIEDDVLGIRAVTLAGKVSDGFDGDVRQVTIPAGFEGELKVTFAVK